MKTEPKICRWCAYLVTERIARGSYFPGPPPGPDRCSRTGNLNVVSGEMDHEICEDERRQRGANHCSPMGRFWKPLPPPGVTDVVPWYSRLADAVRSCFR